jgi:hypothetical protein
MKPIIVSIGPNYSYRISTGILSHGTAQTFRSRDEAEFAAKIHMRWLKIDDFLRNG